MTYPKVLVLSATPLEGPWATSRLMADLFANWPRASLTQVTVTRPGSDPDQQPVESLYLELSGTRNPIRVVGQIRRLFEFVGRTKPDVIYFRSAGWPVTLELLALLLVRRPVVTHIMDDWPESLRVNHPGRSRVMNAVLRRVLAKSSERLAISQPMADAFADRYGVPFGVVHAGTEQVQPVNASPADPSRERVILYSGSVAEDQTASSLVDLAQAVAVLRDRAARVRLRVAPSGEIPSSLRTQLKAAGAVIEDQTTRAGYLERLASADIVVATANFDPTSIAFLRYSMPNKLPDLLASGTPVLIYAPGELSYVELARKEGWAYIADRNDGETLVSAIDDLLQSDPVRAALVASAARACETAFAWPKLRDRFERALRSAAA